MNGHRFDAMTLLLAQPRSRRALVKALAGAAAGPLALLGRPGAQARAIKGALTTNDPTFIRCGSSDSFHYDAYTHRHDGGPFSASLTGRGTAPVTDPYLYLYSNFDPSAPCENIVAENDDGGCGFNAYLSLADLPAGKYKLVVTSISLEDTGKYRLKRNVPDPCP